MIKLISFALSFSVYIIAITMAEAAEPEISLRTPESNIEEIIVTQARMRSEVVTETPVVLRALSGGILDSKGVTDLSGLRDLLPNVHVYPNYLTPVIYIRGIGSNGQDAGLEQQVGLFIDNVNYGAGHWVSGAYVDLDNLAVLEGPQGVYLGKNTIAGGIQIKTKDPGDEFEAYLKAGNEFEAQDLYLEGMISSPINDSLGVRLAARTSNMEGWANNVVTRERTPEQRDRFVRATIVWLPAENVEANLKLTYNDYEDNGSVASRMTLLGCGPSNQPGLTALAPGFFIWPGFAFGTPDATVSGGSANCGRNFDFSNALLPKNRQKPFANITGKSITFNLKWYTGYGDFTSTSSWNDFVMDNLLVVGGTTFEDGTGAIPAIENSANETWSQEFRFQSRFDSSAVNFLAGVYFQNTDLKLKQAFALVPGLVNGNFVESERWSTVNHSGSPGDSKAVFGEIQWKPFDTLAVDFGARYSIENKDFYWVNDFVAPIFTGAFEPCCEPLLGSQSNRDFSPQVIVSWMPDDDFMFFAAYKTGFLAGGFRGTGVRAANQSVSDFEFGSEEVKGGELGAKFYLADRQAQINASVFYYRYTDLQVTTYNPETTAFSIQNAGVSINSGAQIDGVWNLVSGWTLSGNVSFLDSYYDEFLGACLPITPELCTVKVPGTGLGTGVPQAFQQDFSGDATDNAPRWSGRAALDYVHYFDNKMVLHMGAGINFFEKYRVNQFPIQPSHNKVNANISIGDGQWSLALIGVNLTNEFTCGQAAGRTLATVSSEFFCFVDRGRQVKMEAKYQF